MHLLKPDDLDRQIVKSSFASVILPDFQLTIPPGRGQLTTVEGIIRDTVRDLNISQPLRKHMDPDNWKKIDDMLRQLRELIGMSEDEDEEDGGVGRDSDDEADKPTQDKAAHDNTDKPLQKFRPFTVTVDDPSGNSFFQFKGAASEPQWNMRAYNRTFEQNVTLGLVARPEDMPDRKGEEANAPVVPADHKLHNAEEFEERRNKTVVTREDGGVVADEIFSFPSTCSSCGHELETLMQQVNIPYFQVSYQTCPFTLS